jgi:hypothetical protein
VKRAQGNTQVLETLCTVRSVARTRRGHAPIRKVASLPNAVLQGSGAYVDCYKHRTTFVQSNVAVRPVAVSSSPCLATSWSFAGLLEIRQKSGSPRDRITNNTIVRAGDLRRRRHVHGNKSDFLHSAPSDGHGHQCTECREAQKTCLKFSSAWETEWHEDMLE